jgi:hypothetical protein
MPRVGFEPMIPVFVRAKTVHALDSAATVTGGHHTLLTLIKGKAIPVTGRGRPQGCERSRLPQFLKNRLTDGGEAVSLKRPGALYPQEDSWYSYLLEAESTPGTQCRWKN